MIHNEYLIKANQTYELRHDGKGQAIHVFITDSEAIIFSNLVDFVKYNFLGESEIERFYLSESDLSRLYESDKYSYSDLKELANEINNEPVKFARKCSHTGEGINEGFVCGDGDFYFSKKKYLKNFIKKKTDYKNLKQAYKDEYYYFTEWDVESDSQYYLKDGILIDIE